jgi:hypothetical protein
VVPVVLDPVTRDPAWVGIVVKDVDAGFDQEPVAQCAYPRGKIGILIQIKEKRVKASHTVEDVSAQQCETSGQDRNVFLRCQ